MNGRINTPVLWTVGICWLAAPAAQGLTLYVDTGCGNDVKVGTSSDCADTDGPKRTIQAAIDVVTSGDTVIVAPGIYRESINFQLKGITVRSTQGADVTTIQGDQVKRAVVIGSLGRADVAVLDGFTITNGNRGVDIIVGNPVVTNCRIVRNSTTIIGGAGMAISGGSFPIISNCLFLQNTSDIHDYTGGGGGIFIGRADANISNCTFIENSAREGGGIHIGGVYIGRGSDVTVVNCDFFRNSARFVGAGIADIDGGTTTLINCTFRENRFDTRSARGVAVFYVSGHVDLINCALVNNVVGKGRGVTYNNGSGGTANFINCTLAGNTATADTAGAFTAIGDTFTNCILWGNTLNGVADQTAQIFGLDPPTVNYSCVQGWDGSLGGIGNIGDDPLLRDLARGNVRLNPSSPCVDAADNAAVVGVTTDLDGDPRRVDDPTMSDGGAGTPPIVDMGAYEFGDCNNNGVFDGDDVTAGTSADCNGNSIPDECETDCNANDVPDDCDITAGTSDDCNTNGVPDDCEADCNENDVSDDCDITAGTSDDCNANTVPDECEDCNGNGIGDSCDIEAGTSQDCTDNGIPDECEPDCNSNGTADSCDIASGTILDCNGNGIPDECDIESGTSEDCTGNGAPDECDSPQRDCNNNGIGDPCDVVAGTSQDADGDGRPDECCLATDPEQDCNGNGFVDLCDIADGSSKDCNGNQIPDECEIAQGVATDRDGDGVPDACGKIYWSVNGGGFKDPKGTMSVVQRANTDGSNDEILVGGVFYGIELDVASGRMHLLTLDAFWQARLDGADLISVFNPRNPGTGFGIDLVERKFYWMDPRDTVGGFSVIKRANLDGTDIENAFVTNQENDGYVMAIDPLAQKVYWGEAHTHKIWRADTDGGNIENIYTAASPDPRRLELDLCSGKMYWSETGSNSIRRADLDGSNVEVVAMPGGPGLALDLVRGKLYSLSRTAVSRSNLDGTNKEIFDIALLGFPSDIEVDPGEPDCNRNGVLDRCDVVAGFSEDLNFNMLPDECELTGGLSRVGRLPTTSLAAPGAQEMAIQVKIKRMYIDTNEDPTGCPVRGVGLPDLTVFENQVRYLGAPSAFDDNHVSMPKFVAAELQCDPHYRDWSSADVSAEFGPLADAATIYFYGRELVPCSVYEVRQATQACVESGSEDCFSDPLEIRTALWGDLWSPFGVVNFTDIGKVVDAFKGIAFVASDPPEGAPRKVQAMLRGNSAPLDSTINFTDIGKDVDAFKTIAYAEDGPTACP